MTTSCHEQQYRRVFLLSLLLLTTTIIISLFIGRYSIHPRVLFPLILQGIGMDPALLADGRWLVFYYIRLPRILLVSSAGAMLAMTGAAYQGIFRNPLVSPDILGVTAGAGFGVALGILLSESLFIIYLLAFLSGTLAVSLAYLISRLAQGGGIMMMVLGGILVTSFFNALLSLLKYLADPYDRLPGIVFWIMGSFSRTTWRELALTLPFMVLGMTAIFLMRWWLNGMAMGEEEARSLGIPVNILKSILIALSTLMVSACVATTGQISWVGLVIPHMARYLIGANHRYMIPIAALFGASFLLIMDNIARALTTTEIPISIITALFGAPFFAHLIMARRESGWHP